MPEVSGDHPRGSFSDVIESRTLSLAIRVLLFMTHAPWGDATGPEGHSAIHGQSSVRVSVFPQQGGSKSRRCCGILTAMSGTLQWEGDTADDTLHSAAPVMQSRVGAGWIGVGRPR